MIRTSYRGRRGVRIDNEVIRLTVLEEGGHVAEFATKATGTNPLWVPPWPSIEVSSWSAPDVQRYGGGSDGRLLAGIMGHNLCLYLFGPPSPEEEASGIAAHGEAGVVAWTFTETPNGAICRCTLPASQLEFERRITLDVNEVRFQETVSNLTSFDRPIAWTQHVTLGPPFLEKRRTQFVASTSPSLPAARHASFPDHSQPAELNARQPETLSCVEGSGGYAAYLMDDSSPLSFFTAWSPTLRTAITYRWQTSDFPWLGVWDENCSREHSPWNGRTLARGMEFGVSPFPETRRDMIERQSLFGRPAYRWITARGRLMTEYSAAVYACDELPSDPQDCATIETGKNLSEAGSLGD